MRFKHLALTITILALVGLMGTSFSAYAGRGGNCDGPGSANCPRGGYGAGGGANLTDEQIAVVQKEREAFFESTRELRDRAYQKSLELQAEMAKQNPDAAKAAALQKEVSGLRSELGAKRLEQQLKMKKEHPEIYSKAYGRGSGMGGGRGMGPGSGRGPGGKPCCQ
ncbi:MAG TPA: periplasmic heavy metal sensor [Desulfobacterales bacterium]|nr:periplasmic heavy metal sensor [Desulfobacterales bacterium]